MANFKPAPIKIAPILAIPTAIPATRPRRMRPAPEDVDTPQEKTTTPPAAPAAQSEGPKAQPAASLEAKGNSKASDPKPITPAFKPIEGIKPIGGIAPIIAAPPRRTAADRIASMQRAEERRKQAQEAAPPPTRRATGQKISNAERASTEGPTRRRGTGKINPSPEDRSGYDGGFAGYDSHYYETSNILTPEEQAERRRMVEDEDSFYTRDSGLSEGQSRHVDCPFVPDEDGAVPALNWTAIGGDMENAPSGKSENGYVPSYKDPELPKEAPPPPENYGAIKNWLFSTLQPEEQDGVTPDDPIELLAMDMFLGRRPDIYQRYINKRHKDASNDIY